MATVLDLLVQQSPQLQELGRQFDREYGPGIRALQELFNREYGPGIRTLQDLGRLFDREYGPGIRALLDGAWDERLAAAVGRLETRAEGILDAPPEPELKTVEALSADMVAVIEAAPSEAREDTKTWLAWLLVFLVDAIAGDPAKEALRHALMQLLVVLLVLVTEPTLPTPPASAGPAAAGRTGTGVSAAGGADLARGLADRGPPGHCSEGRAAGRGADG